MPRKNIVSLQQIADQAGVTKATVSLALKNHPRISDATKKRIQALAKQLGYRPNPELSKLMSATKTGPLENQGVLGFIRSGPTKDWYLVEKILFSELSRAAQSHGYTLEPFWLTDPQSSPERINRIMWTRGIEGLIIPMIHPELFHQGARTLPVDWQKFCVVEVSDTLNEPPISGVRHNHYKGMLTTLAKLEVAGYHRIGLSMWQDVELRTHHRWSAVYLLWKEIRGLSNELPLFLPDVYDTQSLLRWVEKNQLDVVVSPGLEVYRMLREGGVDIPGDLGYATLDQWGVDSEAVTGINQDVTSQAQIAIDLLIGQIHRADIGIPKNPIYALHPGVWCQGKSTRRPKKRSAPSFIDQERLVQSDP